MQVRHPSRDRQTEARASAALGVGERAEPFEDPVAIGCGHPRTVVGDLELPSVRRACSAHPHGAAGRAVPGGVVEQVAHQLVQPRGVGQDL